MLYQDLRVDVFTMLAYYLTIDTIVDLLDDIAIASNEKKKKKKKNSSITNNFAKKTNKKYKKKILRIIKTIDKYRYLISRETIIKFTALINICLYIYKLNCANLFRLSIRINLSIFDRLVERLQN